MSRLFEKDHVFIDDFGQELYGIHPKDKCHGLFCPVHRPSAESKAIGRLRWRSDRGFFERVCEHGVGHPDPDDFRADPIHGCDGCCQKAI